MKGVFLTTLNRIGCGAIILDESDEVDSYNDAAREILLNHNSNRAVAHSDVKALVDRILGLRSKPSGAQSESWTLLNASKTNRLAVNVRPIRHTEEFYGKTIIFLVDLDQTQTPNAALLGSMFNLTPAEAHIAVQITKGQTLADIAAGKDITLWTIRTQLGSIFSKTGTRRQSDLVSLMLKLSLLT